VDGDGLIPCCKEFKKYLGSTFVSKLGDTPSILKQISQARKAFDAMSEQVFRNKRTRKETRRSFYQTIAVELTAKKLETFHHGCLRKMCNLTMWNVAEEQQTNETKGPGKWI
jgi:hypothetical protein